MTDYIDRQAAIDALERIFDRCEEIEAHFRDGDPDKTGYKMLPDYMTVWEYLHQLPSAEVEPVKHGYLEERRWIPCSDGLPDDIRPVIVTWKNTAPASYYQHIVGKHFTGTACYKNGKWYWYSSITEDMLAEYGRYDPEEFDEAIECIAWMPLPKPYKEEGENNEDQND